MAADGEAPLPAKEPPLPNKKKKKTTADRRSSLPWSQSIPSDDPFSLLLGSSEGGFLSLEEIDESEYGLVPGTSGDDGGEVLRKSKKRKRRRGDDDSGDGVSVPEELVAHVEESGSREKSGDEKKKKKMMKKKKKKKKKRRRRVSETSKAVDETDVEKFEDAQEFPAGSVSEDEVVFNEDEYWAWKELRLHPLLMKAIYKLGFKEPTPIQKSCIPAAAHRGKDVIGAAETGSGKTLAFGLPILQRLLEEREKAEKKAGNESDTAEEAMEERSLRALIVTPTRELALQICSHLREIAVFSNIGVVPIVGGIYTEKQERLLRRKPEIIVGTPGRLWELMSTRQQHLVELESLSFFVLDEADRMVEKGHFRELQSIIDMLPRVNDPVEQNSRATEDCRTVLNLARKKRQTFVFSATIALSSNFRKKLKHGSLKSKSSSMDGVSSLETLSQLAGIRVDAAIVDLTNAAIMAHKLEESFIECTEEDKEAYLYYLLSVHGQGRTIVFCTSIAALQRISSLMRIASVNVWTLHAQMQQRARLKAIDCFRGSEHGTLVATDVAARGLDIPGVRTVVHFQLPHSAEVYVHRSGRTARASADGCSIALISPKDKLKFASLCKSFSKETLQRFPIDDSYMPEVFKRLSLARQIDKVLRKNSHENAEKSWLERNAKSAELSLDDSDGEDEQANNHKRKKESSLSLKKLQQELNEHLAQPLQPKSFSRRFLAGAGISPLLQQQLEQLAQNKPKGNMNHDSGKGNKFVVIGQGCIEPLEALRSGGQEVSVGMREFKERMEIKNRQKVKREHKKRLHEQRRKQRRKVNT